MKQPSDHLSILVVDDAPDTLEVFRRNLTWKGYQVLTAPGVEEAICILDSRPVDLVITDFKMPKVSGMELIRHVRENFKDTEVIMITGFASVESAVKAVKTGAEEYLPKPFTDEELFDAVKRAFSKLHRRRASCDTPETPTKTTFGIIGESPSIQKVIAFISKAASTAATALLTGESGTGKELVARAIHYGSPRAAAPFVPVNCGGIPEGLLESELFGHLKGAFTGATETRAGFFQTADGGSVFLDEISDTSPSMQAKLLRVLQDKEVCMVGATQSRKVDVRIIAATNKDLPTLIRKGLFREDLFFRINVLASEIPPLRDRGDDVLLLTQHFASRFAAELAKPVPRFSDGVLQALKTCTWPGNVRELENLIQRLVVMSENDVIDTPDLPALMRFTALKGSRVHRSLAEVEADHIRSVLASVNGNKSRTAEILQIDRKTLREKMRNYGIDI
ncbi:sigma-54-dependent Fis family transcriptional regulator [bacterium]|nr:MAG: sigma-54-dependent Fis family transcriptional regulator [bacterium]